MATKVPSWLKDPDASHNSLYITNTDDNIVINYKDDTNYINMIGTVFCGAIITYIIMNKRMALGSLLKIIGSMLTNEIN